MCWCSGDAIGSECITKMILKNHSRHKMYRNNAVIQEQFNRITDYFMITRNYAINPITN